MIVTDFKYEFTHVRSNTKSIVLSREDINGTTVETSINEWWNGEGMTLYDTDEQSISLHMDQITDIVVAALLIGLVDLKECKRLAKQIKESTLPKTFSSLTD